MTIDHAGIAGEGVRVGRPTVTALICALNEAENLRHVIPGIPEWVDEILLVDGNSTDGTVRVAQELNPATRVVYQRGRGKGVALRQGVEQATGDIVVMLDADGETDPVDMDGFVQPLLDGYDFAKGTRFSEGYKNKPFRRKIGNIVIVWAFNLLYGERYTDLCSGYNAFWRSVVDKVDLWDKNGWNYEPLLIARVHRAGLKIIEVPQRHQGRVSGDSKLPDWQQGFAAMKTVVGERFRRRVKVEQRSPG
jgi:glycosyltransferase involved in cell wall biosynthesis